jgi:branched-chain amino acid transport system substrate-binding protein
LSALPGVAAALAAADAVACALPPVPVGVHAASAAATPGKALKLGQLLPFTNVYTELGNSMRRSTDLYLKTKGNKLANRPVTVVYEDEANNPQVGLQKTQKFIDQDQVDLMLGVVATPIAYAIRNAVDSAKMIWIETNAGGNALTRTTTDCKPSCKSPYIFRSSFSSYQISEPIGEYFGKKGTKDVYLFISDYGFGTESAADFTTGFKKQGGNITGTLKAPLGNADFLPFVTQIKAQPTKDIYSFFSAADAIGYIKAWNQLGMTAAGYKMSGAGFLTEQDVLKEVKELAVGAVTSLFWAITLDNPENKAFVDAYTKEYPGQVADVFAVQAWDGMRAVDEALQKTGGDTADKAKLIRALEDTKFKSPRGDFEFDKDTHNPIQDIYIREVKLQGGQAVNVVIDKFAKVADPGK